MQHSLLGKTYIVNFWEKNVYSSHCPGSCFLHLAGSYCLFWEMESKNYMLDLLPPVSCTASFTAFCFYWKYLYYWMLQLHLFYLFHLLVYITQFWQLRNIIWQSNLFSPSLRHFHMRTPSPQCLKCKNYHFQLMSFIPLLLFEYWGLPDAF